MLIQVKMTVQNGQGEQRPPSVCYVNYYKETRKNERNYKLKLTDVADDICTGNVKRRRSRAPRPTTLVLILITCSALKQHHISTQS